MQNCSTSDIRDVDHFCFVTPKRGGLRWQQSSNALDSRGTCSPRAGPLGTMSTQTIYLFGGCNGAGKTTFAKEFLPNEAHCSTFLNADEIATTMAPHDPLSVAVKAGRSLMRELNA